MPAFGAHGPFLAICPQSTDLGGLVHLPAAAEPDDAHAGHHMPAHEGVDDTGGTSSTCDYGTPAHADQPGSVDFAAPIFDAEGIEQVVGNPLTTIFPPSLPPATGPPAFS